jgi:16S rRNA C967 or C1407 C5-methylase (RsmB/RsmF family)
MVVANDASYKRACLLAGHTRSLRSASLIVTNHDAQHFPITLPLSLTNQSHAHRLWFDRVLCDVPCSGDGTFRKLARTEMPAWSPIFAQRLHQTQVQ